MITEQEVEKAASFIKGNAKKYAKAKAERIYLQEFRKSKKAILVSTQKGTVQEKESYAYSHQEYLEFLDGYRAAIEEEEEIMWMIRAAQAKIEIWRTQQANNRNIDSSHR